LGSGKKEGADQTVAKKKFSKGLGPLLDELHATANNLLDARRTKQFNPEKIASLSPKVQEMCTNVVKIAGEYETAAKELKWNELTKAAVKIKEAAVKHQSAEAAEWRPDQEYINLWKYVTLKMALSAAGLENARTAEDLRKFLEKKNQDINASRDTNPEPRRNIERLSYVWLSRESSGDALKNTADNITKGVTKALALANPAPGTDSDGFDKELKRLVPAIQNKFKIFVLTKTRLDDDLKELKDYVKKPEVANSAAWKKLGDDNVRQGENYQKLFTALIDKCKPEIARLPKVT
jgi:hypothetical protein